MKLDIHRVLNVTFLQVQLDNETLKFHEIGKNASPAELNELNRRIKILEYSLQKYLQIIDKEIN